MTIAEIGELTSTKYYRAVVSSGACTSVTSGTIAVTAATTTWTSAAGGSWNNGAPNSKTAAVISYDYTSSEDFNACSLTVSNGANVVIGSGDNINLFGALTVSSGTFTLNNNANLVQNRCCKYRKYYRKKRQCFFNASRLRFMVVAGYGAAVAVFFAKYFVESFLHLQSYIQ